MALLRFPSSLSSSLAVFSSHSHTHFHCRCLFLSHRSFSIANSRRSVPRSASCSQSGNETSSNVMLKDMEFPEIDKWVQSHGFRSGQALMLWKCLYGSNVWAHSHDELEGLNKDFRKMLSENASFKALTVKDILTASDGTRKKLADFVQFGRWHGDRNSCDSF